MRVSILSSSSLLVSVLMALCSTFTMIAPVTAAEAELCATIVYEDTSFSSFPVCPGNNVTEFCDGYLDCNTTNWCDCDVGRAFCTKTADNPCKDGSGQLYCTEHLDGEDLEVKNFFPTCPGFEFVQDGYCDGTPEACLEDKCDCDVGKAFCQGELSPAENNPCYRSSAVSFVAGLGSASLFLMGFLVTTLL